MKNNFKKIILVIVGTASSIGSYLFSGTGIAAATLGSLTAATIFTVEKKKANNTVNTHKNIFKKQEEKIVNKKDLRKEIIAKRTSLKEHHCKLDNLKRSKKSSAEINKHMKIIDDLKNDIKKLKTDLKNL